MYVCAPELPTGVQVAALALLPAKSIPVANVQNIALPLVIVISLVLHRVIEPVFLPSAPP
jgi:NhaP-type Na+/H+ or K+/H+ antiporter